MWDSHSIASYFNATMESIESAFKPKYQSRWYTLNIRFKRSKNVFKITFPRYAS